MSVISFTAIAALFADQIKCLKKAENSVDSGHVTQVEYNGTDKVIKGKVVASMKKRQYAVQVNMTSNNDIESYTCECPKGNFKCHHIAAILLYAHKNWSKTDITCSWKAPVPLAAETVDSVDQIFPSRGFKATTRNVDAEDKKFFLQELKSLNRFSGFYWILQPDPEPSAEHPKALSSIIAASFQNGELKEDLILKNFKVDTSEIVLIANQTTGQRDNALWFKLRQGRLTASNFADIISAVKRNKFSVSLFNKLSGTKSLDGIKSIQWGINHEAIAIKEFEDGTSLKVDPTGLWLDECGYVGGSPDGLVGDDAIIEVKCPYSHRASNSVAIFADKKYCMNGNELKKSHPYYHQVQGLLHLTKRSLCYFVIWTQIETIILSVPKDYEWAENFKYLNTFFESIYLKKILEG